jgi:hypothetical protein
VYSRDMGRGNSREGGGDGEAWARRTRHANRAGSPAWVTAPRRPPLDPRRPAAPMVYVPLEALSSRSPPTLSSTNRTQISPPPTLSSTIRTQISPPPRKDRAADGRRASPRWYGEGEKRLARVFELAAQLGGERGALLFLDEVEALGVSRDSEVRLALQIAPHLSSFSVLIGRRSLPRPARSGRTSFTMPASLKVGFSRRCMRRRGECSLSAPVHSASRIRLRRRLYPFTAPLHLFTPSPRSQVLLRSIDGVACSDRLVVVGATNRTGDMDAALRSRFAHAVLFRQRVTMFRIQRWWIASWIAS